MSVIYTKISEEAVYCYCGLSRVFNKSRLCFVVVFIYQEAVLCYISFSIKIARDCYVMFIISKRLYVVVFFQYLCEDHKRLCFVIGIMSMARSQEAVLVIGIMSMARSEKAVLVMVDFLRSFFWKDHEIQNFVIVVSFWSLSVKITRSYALYCGLS